MTVNLHENTNLGDYKITYMPSQTVERRKVGILHLLDMVLIAY